MRLSQQLRKISSEANFGAGRRFGERTAGEGFGLLEEAKVGAWAAEAVPAWSRVARGYRV